MADLLQSVKRFTKQEQMEWLINEIYSRATRHERASDLKEYLLSDLKAIAERADELIAVAKSEKDEYWA